MDLLKVTQSRWKEGIIGILVLVAIVLVVSLFHKNTTGMSAKTSKTNDSMEVTKPAFDSSLLASRNAQSAHVDTVTRFVKVAVTSRAIADSLAALKQWESAYYKEKETSTNLQLALDAQKAATADADRRARLEESRRIALEDFNANLKKDLVKTANCKIAYVIPCATRTQVAVTGIIAGSITTFLVLRKNPTSLPTLRHF